MDKRIVNLGAIPLPQDILEPQRNAEIALGMIMKAAFGTTTVTDGLVVTQQSTPDMTVQVGQGMIISQSTVDTVGSGFGSLPYDGATPLVKIGVNLSPVNMTALVAPPTPGASQNWLLEAQLLEQDTDPVAEPYYNAAAPSVPFSGPNNSGAAQNTRRRQTVQLQWKGGIAAATGQQITPAPDAGWVGIAVVILTNGQSSITNSSIVPYTGTPSINTKLPYFRKRLTAPLNLYVSPLGNDNNSGLAASDAFATFTRAWSLIVSNYDLSGFNVTVNCANGSYNQGLLAAGSVLGLGTGNTITFLGNTTSPAACSVSVNNQHGFLASAGANIQMAGFAVNATGSVSTTPAGGVVASGGGASISLSGPMLFVNATGSHIWATQTGSITIGADYTITGSAANHYLVTNGTIIGSNHTVTVNSTPTFSTFASANVIGFMQLLSVTFSGGATGQRYLSTNNSVIATNGGGANYFPGNSAGVATTGLYS